MKNKKILTSVLLTVSIILGSLILIKPIINNINFGLDLKGGFEVLYLVENLNEKEKVTTKDTEDTYKAIRNRIDTLGVSEPEISIEGDKIRVKLPGVTNESEARKRLSTPAVLTFRNTSNEELMTSNVLDSPGAKLDYNRTTNKPVVALSIKDNDTFYRVTKKISESSDKIITIWLDFQEGDTYKEGECEGSKKCISAAAVTEGFMDNVIIEGNFTEEEAQELVDLINSGSLPTKLTEISTKTVDSSFGNDTLKNIGIAGIITFIIIILIIIICYRLSGIISGVCLIFYTLLVFILFNAIDGVLTLTGIAALILGIGMAVDSSVITLEKIKEELSNGKTLEKAYTDGNKRSLVSLIDANITTFIAALILFIFGESSVKGFATMLMLTIVVTAFSMILLNRIIMSNLIKSKIFNGKEKLFIGNYKKSKERSYKKASLINITTVSLIIIVGTIFILIKGLNLGIDFKGGSSISLKNEKAIEEKLIKEKLNDYKIEEINKIDDHEYNIRLKDTLTETEIKSLKKEFDEINYKSDISVISNIVKKDLTKNAIKSLIIASIAILIYIAIRFTSRFAISSIIAILTDVLVTIAIFTTLRFEINFIFIAGILTIIGYSINDTIVVFDMIRDKYNLEKNKTPESLTKLVNESISLSLRRNMVTSITTLTAVIVLLLMNTSGVKEFNITVLIGLTAGTFSSLLIAPYIWLKLEIKNLKKPKKEDNEEKEIKERLIKGINS